MKRIPRIKFPQRHPKPSGSAPQQAKTVVGDAPPAFFSRATSDSALGGKASDQPKRTPMSNEEIEAILVQELGWNVHRKSIRQLKSLQYMLDCNKMTK